MPLTFRYDVTPRYGRQFPTSQLEEAVTYRPRDYDVVSMGRPAWRSGQGQGHGRGRSSSSTERSLKNAAYPRPYFYDLELRRPRVQTYSTRTTLSYGSSLQGRRPVHDTCTCNPAEGHTGMPSMTYEHQHCPRHPHRTQLPVIPEQFTYPWTTQTYRPSKRLEYGYKRGQILPPSAVTAPPFTLYTNKTRHSHGSHHHHHHHQKSPPPHTAPERRRTSPSRLLTLSFSDRRLRRVDRRRASGHPSFGPLQTREAGEEVAPWDSVSQVAGRGPRRGGDDVSPWDSVSQVSPLRPFHSQPRYQPRRPPPSPPAPALVSPRAESAHGWWRWRRRERESQWSRRAAADTPLPLRHLDPPLLPSPSTRLFKGDYNPPDDSGVMARAKRRQLRTV